MIGPEYDLSRYKAVFAPLQFVVSQKQAANIRKFVHDGGLFVTSFRLGVKDESSQIVRTPLPGLLSDVMGVTIKDYVPNYGAKVGVQFSSPLAGPDGESTLWADLLQPSSASVLAKYSGATYAGEPAITTNAFGAGQAVYIGADLDPASLARVLGTLLASKGVKPPFDVPRGVELTVRTGANKKWLFLLNHTPASQEITLPGQFTDALTGTTVTGKRTLPAYDVLVLQPA